MKKALLMILTLFSIFLFANLVSATVNVTLISPVDYDDLTNSNISFRAIATTNETLKNCSLYSDYSGNYQLMQTLTSVTNNVAFEFNATGIIDSVYNYTTNYHTWDVVCFDNSTSGTYASPYHYSVEAVDETSPNITSIISPSGTIQNTDDISFSVSVIDDWGLSNCSLYTDKTGTLAIETNSTLSISGTSGTYAFTVNNLTDKNYTWNVACMDSNSNKYTSSNQIFEVDYINDAPVYNQTWSTWVVISNSGVNYLYIEANDYNGNTVTFTSNNTGKIPLVNLGSNKARISYNPTIIETFSVVISACDGITCTNQTLNVQSRTKSNSMTVTSPTVEAERGDNRTTATFTIINTGDETLTVINITSDAASQYNVTFSGAPASLASKASTTVTVYVDTSVKERGGINSIGTITVTTDKVTQTATLYLETDNMLVFKEISITGGELDDDYEEIEDQSGKVIDSIAPGDNITIIINLDNLFDDNDDDIENIDLEIEIKDMAGDGDDLEFDDSFDVDGDDDSGKKKFTFTVPYDLEDEDELEITITAEGKDQNKAIHSVQWNGIFLVERENHLLKIESLTAQKTRLKTCEDMYTYLDIDVINLGDNEEKDVVVKIWNSVLGIDDKYYYDEMEAYDDFDDEEDSRHRIHHKLQLPTDTKPGTYTIQVNTYYKTNNPNKYAIINIDVVDCGETTTTKEETITQTTNTISVKDSTEAALKLLGSTKATTNQFVVSTLTTKDGLFNNDISKENSFKIAMIVGNVVAAAAIIILLIKFLMVGSKSSFGF